MQFTRVRRGHRFVQFATHVHEHEWTSAGAARVQKQVMRRMMRREGQRQVAEQAVDLDADFDVLRCYEQFVAEHPPVVVRHGLHHLVRRPR